MATIGTFKSTGDEYVGEIVTLTVQARKVRIVPADKRPSDSAPTHRVFVGQAEIGAAWTKTSQGAGTTSPSSSTTRASPRRFSPTSSRTTTARAIA